jgi:hypothetical protein
MRMIPTRPTLLSASFLLASLLTTSLLTTSLLSTSLPALGEEWASRSGHCFEWQGYWTVDREPSGGWNGYIDFENVGGPCAAPSGGRLAGNAHGVIVGADFFAVTDVGGQPSCLWYGTIRGEQARGYILCPGAQGQAFALSFKRAN